MRFRSSVALALAATLAVPGAALARRTGIVASGCDGCHGSAAATIDVSASPAVFAPGDDVTFTVTLRRASGALNVGGIYIEKLATGELSSIAGEGLTRVPDDGFTHSQPRAAAGGAVSFRFGWRAPAAPGGLNFDVYGLAADGDGRPSGDSAGTGRFRGTFGCASEELYYDSDGDGVGSVDIETILACAGAALPDRFSRVSTDCNENDQLVFPGAIERCNQKDDDCDGQIDEDADPVELWPDTDGDGYYGARTGTPVIGCSGIPGYAAESGDCAPGDPRIHRDAVETCNLLDDNCDGRADERTRPQCGVGFCRAESVSCDPTECFPSEPQPERCNLLDDDCDGEVDDGELCGAGQACLGGKCVALGDAPSPGGASGGAGAPAQSAGTGGADAGGDDAGGSCALSPARGSAPAWTAALALVVGIGRRRKRA